MSFSTDDSTSGPYACNGSQTAFTYDFKIFDDDDLEVYLKDAAGDLTLLTKTTHYSVAGVGDANGGSITTVATYASGNSILMRRKMSATQETTLGNQGRLFPEAIEAVLDRIVMMVRYALDLSGQALRFPLEDDFTPGQTLPKASERANTALIFDASGDIALSADAATSAASAAASAATAVAASESLEFWDQFAQQVIIRRDLTAPPVSPSSGDAYIVGTGATGDWATHDNEATVYVAGAWRFFTPEEGWTLYDQTADEFVRYSGAAWAVVPLYSVASQAEAEAGTENTKVMTPLRVQQAIDAQRVAYVRNGLECSKAAATSVLTKAGEATDDTRSKLLVLSSDITKLPSAAWAVGDGNGSLDTGSLAINTWYFRFLISRTDTGVVDVLDSASISTPTMPADYDIKALIGAFKTDGSGNVVGFVQIGDRVFLDDAAVDLSSVAISSTASLHTLTVPPGLKVRPLLNYSVTSGANVRVRASSPDTPDKAASSAHADAYTLVGTGTYGAIEMHPVNASGQIRLRADGSTTITVATRGWVLPGVM